MSRASGPDMVADECAACGAVRVLAACLVGRVPCPRCAVYVCGHVRVSERPTCPVTGCNGRGPHEVGGAVVLTSSPAPAECIGDEARAELQALAEALNQTAPIVDAVPFTLRGEVKQDDGARATRLPF